MRAFSDETRVGAIDELHRLLLSGPGRRCHENQPQPASRQTTGVSLRDRGRCAPCRSRAALVTKCAALIVALSGCAGGSHDAGTRDAARADTGGDVADRAGAGTHADAASGAGGAGGYSPCPGGGAPCIIMPLGDSITDGYPYEAGGYRVELFHRAVQASRPITFVGRSSNGPATVDGMAFPRGHEGHVGYDIDTDPRNPGITPLVDAVMAMFHPHIVLLQIGTNDVDVSYDLANAPARLGVLIDKVINDAPNALLLVAQVTPSTDAATNARIMTYNAAIPAVVRQRAAAGKHVAVVDVYSAVVAHADFASALMWDDLHPDTDGYTLLGDTWYGAIESVLKR